MGKVSGMGDSLGPTEFLQPTVGFPATRPLQMRDGGGTTKRTINILKTFSNCYYGKSLLRSSFEAASAGWRSGLGRYPACAQRRLVARARALAASLPAVEPPVCPTAKTFRDRSLSRKRTSKLASEKERAAWKSVSPPSISSPLRRSPPTLEFQLHPSGASSEGCKEEERAGSAPKDGEAPITCCRAIPLR